MDELAKAARKLQLLRELAALDAPVVKREPMTREAFYKTMYHIQQAGPPAHPADPVSQALTKDAFESLVHRVAGMLGDGFYVQDSFGHYGIISHWGDTSVQADIYRGNDLHTAHWPFSWLKWEGGTRLRQIHASGAT